MSTYAEIYSPQIAEPDERQWAKYTAYVQHKILARGFRTDVISHKGWEVVTRWAAKVMIASEYARENGGDRSYFPPQNLLFFGRYGIGKTMLAELLASIIQSPDYLFEVYTADEVEHVFYREDFEWRCNNLFDEQAIVLDDLGSEMGVRHFGNLPPMDTILSRLHDAWRRHRKPVILTTNLSDNELFGTPQTPGRYGERLRRRFAEMFVKIKFEMREKP